MKSLNGLLPPSYGACETAGEDVQHLSLELTCIRLICSSCQVSMDTDLTKLHGERETADRRDGTMIVDGPDMEAESSMHARTLQAEEYCKAGIETDGQSVRCIAMAGRVRADLSEAHWGLGLLQSAHRLLSSSSLLMRSWRIFFATAWSIAGDEGERRGVRWRMCCGLRSPSAEVVVKRER